MSTFLQAQRCCTITRATPKTEKTKSKVPKPKRPMSGYMAYGLKRRPEIKASMPGITFADLTKQVAGEWDILSEDEKKPYLKIAEMDKIRYQEEKNAYESKK